MEEDVLANGGADKRKNIGGGQAQVVPNNAAARIQAGANPK